MRRHGARAPRSGAVAIPPVVCQRGSVDAALALLREWALPRSQDQPVVDHMMNPERLTVKSAEALNDASAEPRRHGNPQVYDTHLLLALLSQTESIVLPLLQKLGVNAAAIREAIGREIDRTSVV